ncbi:MAG TPA: glycosyltransferase family 4 protein [Gaiellaceae bacterium]|nr:glycosyltransferase family 4 protein [Gaiellaceae bacterium]
MLHLSADPGVPILGHKGASVHVRELVSAMADARATVRVVSPRIGAEGDVLPAPIELVSIEPVLPREHADASSLLDAVARQAAQVRRIAERFGADAVYERFSLFSDGGVKAARALGIPHVLEVNAPLREEALRYRTLPHAELAATIERRVFAMTDRVFAVSMTLARLLDEAGLAAGRIEVAPNAVDPAKFPIRQRSSEGPFTIGFAGSLKPWHGVEVLLEAFRHALEAIPSLRLEVIGDGPGRAAVEHIGDLPAARFAYHGALSHAETLRLLSRWDVGAAPFVAVPAFYFSPLKLVEYMAAGLCPVASDQPEIRELLGGGDRGMLVPPGDAGALAQALVALARNPERTSAIGLRAREYVMKERSWSRNAERALVALRGRPAELVA